VKTKSDRANHPSPRARRHYPLPGLLAALILCCVGCIPETELAGDPPTAAVNPVGSYSLVSVDGKPVPCRVTHDGHAMVIQSGRFLIHADGTCRSQMFLEGRDAGIEVKATYIQAGPQLTMTWQGAGRTIGNVEGDTFTMKNEGRVFSYQRQMQNVPGPGRE
jgi:hypothetical protein